MSTRLIQVLAFTNVASGAQATLAHNLNIEGTAILPDYLVPANANFSVISVTTANVIVQNNGAASDSCDVWCERKHSIDRALGGAILNLTPQPFIPAYSPGSGSTSTRLTNTYYPDNTPKIIRYLRTTGNDSNDGLTPTTAWATLNKGLDWLAVNSVNQPQVLDITGCTFSASEQLNLGVANLGSSNGTFDPAGTGPNNFISRATCEIQSELALITSPINITGVAADATTGLYSTVNVSNTLVVNANRGQFLVGSGPGEWAVIQSNGVNTMSITTTINPQTWTAPIGIYTYGATIEAGDPADGFSNAIVLNSLCDWFFTGIRLRSVTDAKAVAVTVSGTSPIYFQLCDIAGIQLSEGGEFTSIDASYIHDKFFGVNGGSMIARNCYFRGITNLHHGSGVFCDVNECIMENHINPFGGGVTLSKFNFSTANSLYTGGTLGGVTAAFGNSRLTNCVLSNNGSPGGLIITDGCHCIISNVDGSGNTGHGVVLTNAGYLRSLGGTSAVTGSIGNISMGGSGTIAYGALPTDDLGSAAGTRQGVFGRTA